jgi:hypothetical protein
MRFFRRNSMLHIALALLFGFGVGLAYSWLISPVKYVDASPAILRADFKEQYRLVIAASYASTHDLARARARLELLSDTDPIGALSAQAQRMSSAGEANERTQSLARLAADLKADVVSVPFTSTPFPTARATPALETQISKTTPSITVTPKNVEPTFTPTASTADNGQTPLAPPPIFIDTPQVASTPAPTSIAPFALVGQDNVCDPALQPGLLQFTLIDSRRKQIAGIKIAVTSIEGEDSFFTGFKPEIGNGYADFVMQAETSYSVRVAEGGAFIASIAAPACATSSGKTYLGGWALTFQQQ